MSQGNTGTLLLHALRTLIVSCLKIIAIIVGWGFTGVGYVLNKIGSIALKLAEK